MRTVRATVPPGEVPLLQRRWSRFYEALGLPFRFDSTSHSGPYFYLSYQDCWVHALEGEPSQRQRQEAELLARLTNKNVFLHYGHVAPPDEDGYLGEKWLAGGHEYDGQSYWWCECPVCGMCGIEFEGRASRLHCGCVRRTNPDDKAISARSPRLLEAYRLAAEVS